MRLGNALAFVVVLMCPVRLLTAVENTRCQMRNQSDYMGGHCPLKLSPVQPTESGEPYSECISVHVWMRADDFHSDPKIEILSSVRLTIRPKKSRKPKGSVRGGSRGEINVRCSPHINKSFTLWELVHDCVMAEAQSVVHVSFSTTSTNCSYSYTVPDPVPEFHLSVDQRSRSINVTVEPGAKVYTRLCYQKNPEECIDQSPSTRITIDPSQSRSAILNIRYLLPCVCVQVYYTYRDARRVTKCPFKNKSLGVVRDVWLSSEVTLFESSVAWSSECPASYLKPSASLCWRQDTHICTPVLNSTLEEREDRQYLKYNTSTVDRHPQMCVQFSLQDSHHISCPFQSDMSSWEAHIGPGWQSVFVYLTSSVPAKFSAQLCVLNERGCTSRGHVHSVRTEGNTVETQMNVPLHFPAEQLCVQVWQSDPALHGKRILCPDYTHRRCGMLAVAALVFVVVVTVLGILIHHLTKKGAPGWLCIQKPVLLVCSSEQSAHVSAVCALASILQGELCASVRMALWAQSSQRQAGAGVADLGPLPWLYGQWEAVRKAQGKVLIIWSPEAKKSYDKWREERAEMDRSDRKKEENSKAEVRHEEIRVEMEKDLKVKEKRGKCRKEKAAGKEDSVKLFDDKAWDPQNAPSSVTGPVFMAALSCLQGALQECKGHGVAFVYFQGLGHSRDIPKDFRGVPRYCLPQDFRGLIQELGGMARGTRSDKSGWRCWPRLLSKILSLWLARRLAHRLRTWLPQTQTQGKKIQGPRLKSSQEMMSERTQSRLKLPLSANMTRPVTVQEQEPLYGSPWRREELDSQVSPT
ncbi:uncharacterized protein LOC139931127 [Centroberyx gerrardi]